MGCIAKSTFKTCRSVIACRKTKAPDDVDGVPETFNVGLNPFHHDAKRIAIVEIVEHAIESSMAQVSVTSRKTVS